MWFEQNIIIIDLVIINNDYITISCMQRTLGVGAMHYSVVASITHTIDQTVQLTPQRLCSCPNESGKTLRLPIELIIFQH
jgi:hypothetical protein